jgi:hypothetical protein
MFLQQFNQKTSHKITRKKGEKAKKCLLGDLGSSSSSRGAPTHTKTQKKKYKLEGKKKKPCALFNQASSFCARCTTGVVTADTKAVAARVKRLVLTTR